MSEIETYCAKQVKTYDYDRFLITLFAPAVSREHLFALYAFNHEVAKIREAVSEPMLGEIRLQWWREAIEGIYADEPRNHEVVLPLHRAVRECGLEQRLFLDIINARTADIYDENPKTLDDFENYLGATSGNLMKLATQIIGENDEHVLSLAHDMGMVWGLIGSMRSIRYHISLKKVSFPNDVLDQYGVQKRDIFAMDENDNVKNMIQGLCTSAEQYLDQISQDKKLLSKEVRSLFLLCALSKSYLSALKKTDYDPFELNEKANTFPRQCRLFFSALFGIL